MKALTNYINEKYLIDIDVDNFCDDYDSLLRKYKNKMKDLKYGDSKYFYVFDAYTTKGILCEEDIYDIYIKYFKNLISKYKSDTIQNVKELTNIITDSYIDHIRYAKFQNFDEEILNCFTAVNIDDQYVFEVIFKNDYPGIRIGVSGNKIYQERKDKYINDAAKIIDFVLSI